MSDSWLASEDSNVVTGGFLIATALVGALLFVPTYWLGNLLGIRPMSANGFVHRAPRSRALRRDVSLQPERRGSNLGRCPGTPRNFKAIPNIHRSPHHRP